MILPVASEVMRPMLRVMKQVQTLDRFLAGLQRLPDIPVERETGPDATIAFSSETSALDCVIGKYSSTRLQKGTVTISLKEKEVVFIKNPPYNKTMPATQFMVKRTTPRAPRAPRKRYDRPHSLEHLGLPCHTEIAILFIEHSRWLMSVQTSDAGDEDPKKYTLHYFRNTATVEIPSSNDGKVLKIVWSNGTVWYEHDKP